MSTPGYEAAGPLSSGTPHARLAALRLAELARDVREAIATPAAGEIDAEQAFPQWIEAAAPRAHAALLRLGSNIQQMAEQILLRHDTLEVRAVDNVIAALREDFLALLALRDATALRRFPEPMKAHAADAAERIVARMRDFERACSLLSTMILHPERMLADGELEAGIAIDLDLAHELQVIASQARGPVALWRYC